MGPYCENIINDLKDYRGLTPKYYYLDAQIIEKYLDQLEEKYQAAILLHYKGHLNCSEMAKVLDIKYSAARNLLDVGMLHLSNKIRRNEFNNVLKMA